MQRYASQLSTPDFVVDENSVDRGWGGQIDWDNVPASYADADGVKMIPGGTVMSKQADGTLIPRAEVDDAGGAGTYAEAYALLVAHATEGERDAAKTGYGVYRGGIFYENMLPDADAEGDLSAAFKTELASNGTGFAFEDFSDSRIS